MTNLLFRYPHAFVIVALGSRRVAQRLGAATPCDQRPRYLARDRDGKYGAAYRAPRQNGTYARFVGSVRRECLDHNVVPGEAHLRRVLREYVAYFDQDRSHQGIRQRVPGNAATAPTPTGGGGIVRASPVLGGLHHTYRRAA